MCYAVLGFARFVVCMSDHFVKLLLTKTTKERWLFLFPLSGLIWDSASRVF